MKARFASMLTLAAVLAMGQRARGALLDTPPKRVVFKLDAPEVRRLPLLEAFYEADRDPSSSLRRYLGGPYGRWKQSPWITLPWLDAALDHAAKPIDPLRFSADADDHLFGFEADDEPALRFVAAPASTWPSHLDPSFIAPVLGSTGPSLKGNGFDVLWSLPPRKPVRDWRCRRWPVRLARINGETDMVALVKCDGTIASEALDRVSWMTRVPEAPRSGELLPDEPDPRAASRGEWVTGVRLVHPRLVWALQKIADAFPWKAIYIYSGYRPEHDKKPKPGSHHSMHSEARAVDIAVLGVPQASVFQACRALTDVGCGFYPNSKFVHVDVRRSGSGHPFWIDISGPGEPAHYVDSWPGVIESGGLVWDPDQKAKERSNVPGSDPSCTRRTGP